jgi:hypothetical protein
MNEPETQASRGTDDEGDFSIWHLGPFQGLLLFGE